MPSTMGFVVTPPATIKQDDDKLRNTPNVLNLL